MKTSKLIRDLVEKAVAEAGYILEDVTYQKEGSNYVLTIVIDKQGVMTVDDCVTVTNIVNPIIDAADPIKESYILDVCSKEKGCE